MRPEHGGLRQGLKGVPLFRGMLKFGPSQVEELRESQGLRVFHVVKRVFWINLVYGFSGVILGFENTWDKLKLPEKPEALARLTQDR